MAINKYILSALKTLSYMEFDLKANYKLIRQLERAAKKPRIKLTYHTWDYYVGNDASDIPVRIFTPERQNEKEIVNSVYPVIVFFHGGGWVTGDLDSYEKVCMTIARQTGHLLIAVNYRLAPENPFPAALEDCYRAVSETIQWQKTLGVPPANITLMGDSAGGNLAAAVSLYMRDKGEETVGKQILIYPATYNDHTETSPFSSVSENGMDYLLTSKRICDYSDLYCGEETNRKNPYFAPLLAKDFSNQPDTLIITAQYDPLRDEGEEYGRRLKVADNRVITYRIKDALNGYFSLPVRFSLVKNTYKIINDFLQDDAMNKIM